MNIKQFFSLVLCGCLMLPQSIPTHAEAELEENLHMKQFQTYQQYANAAELGDLSAVNYAGDTVSDITEVLPVQFDLRKQGLVSSVKNQGSYGMCWAFSAISSLEGQLIRRHPKVDLSEWHLAYYTYSPQFGFPLRANTDMDDVFEQGGNSYMVLPMLTGWIGPVSESVFPFDDMSVLDPDTEWNVLQSQAEYHVSDMSMYAYDVSGDTFQNQVQAVKQAIFQGNTMSVSYYHKSACYQSAEKAYYFDEPETNDGTYHAVNIIGWDDDFSAENFNTAPEGNGAWLVKNSWGTTWGDCGYFWISYYDTSILEFYCLHTESSEKHDAIYQHDTYGFWSAFSLEEEDDDVYVANVFTAEKDTYLTSVMLCTALCDENYQIQIYKDVSVSSHTKKIKPASGTLASETSGMLSNTGYHTIDLETPVALQAGETFSIVVYLSGSSGQHITCEAYAKYTMTYPDGSIDIDASVLTEDMIRSDFHENESFYSSDGKKWYDIYDEDTMTQEYTLESADGEIAVSLYFMMGNFCIRGLTQDEGVVIFSEESEALPLGTEIALSVPEQSNIYYSVNQGAYMLYTQPIIMTENMHISAYAENHADSIYEKEYVIQEAEISSLLVIEDGKTQYLDFEQTGTQTYTAVYIPSENAEVLEVYPITTGNISGGMASGERTVIDWEKNYLALFVSQENRKETCYIIYFTDNPEDFLLGDVNLDGEVNAKDASAILIYAAAVGAGLANAEMPAVWLAHGDYTQDGEINAIDASDILIYAARAGAGMI